jgi:hypothetical protein
MTRSIAVLVVAATLGSAGAQAAPQTFGLVFNGSHLPAPFPTPTGLIHVGPFTTTSSLCPSGYGQDIAQTDQTATRLFTCDGSGATFTATVTPHLAEHGGAGTWQIISGTGALADLRGEGTWQSVRLSGTDADQASINFRSTWTGTVDLDATPPTISLLRATKQKLARPAHTYVVRLRLAIRDASGNSVSYDVALNDTVKPFTTLVVRGGTTAGGTVAPVFRVRAKGRALRLKVDAADDVGNTASFAATIRLR